MPTEVDDADSRIKYSGSWQAYSGGTQSSRQWESSIHSTNQNGASATVTFIGTSVRITCTVPSGSGTNSIGIITLDGQRVATVTRTTRSDAVYSDIWYQSPNLANIQHTITISNGGSTSDSPLQLDVIQVEGDVVNTPDTPAVIVSSSKVSSSSNTNPTTTTTPNTDKTSVSSSSSSGSTTRSSQSGIASSSSSSTLTNSSGSSSSTSLTSLSGSASSSSATKLSSGDKTVTQVQVVTTAADGTVSTQTITTPINPDKQLSASSSPPIGRIVGAVVGSLVLVAIVLLLLCLRRRRRVKGGLFLRLGNSSTGHVGTTKLTGVTPFHLEEANVAGTGTNDQPSPNVAVGDVAVVSRNEKNTWPTATTAAGGNVGEPSDELVDLALRRWMERHPDILLNRTALLAAFQSGQSPPGGGGGPGGPSGRFNMSDEDVELGTFMTSMYASTLGSGSSSQYHLASDIPPPSYQSSSNNSASASDHPSRRRSKSPTSPVSPISPASPTVHTQ